MTTPEACSTSITLEQPYGNISTRCIPGWLRRPLPNVAIPFNSEDGKRLFREALLTDGLHGYFSLAETFHTQAEPSYCGPGTLSMVLNSLNIDPGSIWKGNWRFFDENTLRTCDKRKPKDNPLENVMEQGITFEEFLYLAECNGASIIPFLASNTTLAQFRSAILVACTRRLDDIRLVCSYNRSTLGQTGTGHFSPIAGYHSQEDLVLILDVARFKYPSHWIPIELLWQSMCTIDLVTEKSRGFYLISKWSNDLTIQCGINSCKDIDEPNTSNNKVFCSSEESLLLFIDNYLLPTVDLTLSIELLTITILQSLTPVVIQLTTKWVFDLMQKYRLNAVSQSKCIEECKCINLFKLYPSFLPDNVNHSLENNNNECQKPCARVTRSHIHAYAMPTECALSPFIELFEKDINQKLYQKLEEMNIEQYLTITNDKTIYLFGGFSSIIDDNEITRRIECGLTAIFFYALRTEKFLSTIDIFDSKDLSSELKDEINYAKTYFGLL
ncbi:unnamed protein product [Adineta steineri]|uniref:glutathione gamma-glutamylcysteinyltransferase n=1 Tax=Adineta steineri TaxID=433720 RepID=A0A813N4J2_9BILA|nr:unnamed protein product [Adineta steineri]CAF3506304.1 unnamed protein product [Adineta steineri]